MSSLFIFVDVYVTVNNIKVFIVAMETCCCPATKYFVLMLTMISARYCECEYVYVYVYFFLSYKARRSHLSCSVLHYHFWSVRSYHIFPHYLTNGTNSTGRGEITERKMCVLILSTVLPEKILILGIIQRHTIKNVHWSSCSLHSAFV